MLQFAQGGVMTEQEINRAIQYVTAATSYGRDTVAEILRTGLSELSLLSTQSTRRFEREDLLGYLCQWTMKRTGHPEPLVRQAYRRACSLLSPSTYCTEYASVPCGCAYSSRNATPRFRDEPS